MSNKNELSPLKKFTIGWTTGSLIGGGIVFGGVKIYDEVQSSSLTKPAISSVPSPLPVEVAPAEISKPQPKLPCEPASKDIRDKSKDSKACAEEQKHGEVIIVDFGDLSTNQNFTTATKTYLANMTADMITPSITLVKAPENVEQTLTREVTEAGGCLNLEKEKASKIADRMMPELNVYDVVVAFSPYKPCKKSIGGVAEYRGRHADIYNKLPSAAAHEIGHAVGLDHEGEVGRSFATKQYSSVDIATEKDQTLNLQAYFQPNNYKYDEYRPNEIMGYPYNVKLTDNARTNPIEIDFLRRISGRKTLTREITQSPVTIPLEEEQKGAFGLVQLSKPLILNHISNGENKSTTFNQLAIVPTTLTFPAAIVRGYTLYLTDGAKTAEIARGETGSWKIVNGKQTINIVLDERKLKASTTG